MNEKTKVDVSLNAFGGRTTASLAGVNLFQSQLGMTRGLSSELDVAKRQLMSSQVEGTLRRGDQREDKEAELETLRSVKVFLTEKLKQNEQVTCTFQQDIDILKEVIRVEKQITTKTQTQLKQREGDIKVLRQEFEQTE